MDVPSIVMACPLCGTALGVDIVGYVGVHLEVWGDPTAGEWTHIDVPEELEVLQYGDVFCQEGHTTAQMFAKARSR